MEAPPIGQGPDATHGREAIVESSADAMELSSVELPDQDAVDVAGEGYFLGRHIYVLAFAGSAAFIVRCHGACCGCHICMEETGVQSFLYRRAIGLACQAQDATSG